MPMEETVWFRPFDAGTRNLQSIYQADEAPPDGPGVIATGRAFTVSIEAMRLASRPEESWYERVIHPHTDILILTSSALGSKPLIDRVHYYKTDINLEQPLLAHDLLSDAIWVCDDYQDPDPFYVELKVVTIDRSDEQRHAALQGFETFASSAGSIFPVALPYIALGQGVLEGLNKLFDAAMRHETYRISEPLRLFPPRTPRSKTIRTGQYVILSEAIDGTQYELGENSVLTSADGHEPKGQGGKPLSYAVLRIDLVKQIQIDFVISQRVATLLTQLKNDQEGQPAGTMQTSFGFLNDTLKAYTNFTDLQRYQELVKKGASRTAGENEQMQMIEQREELKPFLPKPAPEITAAQPAQT